MSREREAASVAAAERDRADETLLERVAGGNADALSELYERYRTVSYSVALKITADPGAAEDVVQEAFLGVWRNAARYASARGSVRTWILAVVRHRAIGALRRRRPTTDL